MWYSLNEYNSIAKKKKINDFYTAECSFSPKRMRFFHKNSQLDYSNFYSKHTFLSSSNIISFRDNSYTIFSCRLYSYIIRCILIINRNCYFSFITINTYTSPITQIIIRTFWIIYNIFLKRSKLQKRNSKQILSVHSMGKFIYFDRKGHWKKNIFGLANHFFLQRKQML